MTFAKRAAWFLLGLALVVAASLAILHAGAPSPTAPRSTEPAGAPAPRPVKPGGAATGAPTPARQGAHPPAGAAAVQSIELTQPGQILAPGTAATLPIQTTGGDIAYGIVTATAPTLRGNTSTATVTVRLLMTLHADPGGVSLARAGLTGIDFMSHPGADPPRPAPASTPGCAPLPDPTPTLTAGQSMSWCIAAAETDALPADGVQYSTPDGPYLSPVTWIASDRDRDRLP